MTLWCFTAALRECRLDECRECWAAKLAPEIGSNSPKASATMAILVLGHIVVTPVSTGASSATRFAEQINKVTIPAFTSLCLTSPCLALCRFLLSQSDYEPEAGG